MKKMENEQGNMILFVTIAILIAVVAGFIAYRMTHKKKPTEKQTSQTTVQQNQGGPEPATVYTNKTFGYTLTYHSYPESYGYGPQINSRLESENTDKSVVTFVKGTLTKPFESDGGYWLEVHASNTPQASFVSCATDDVMSKLSAPGFVRQPDSDKTVDNIPTRVYLASTPGNDSSTPKVVPESATIYSIPYKDHCYNLVWLYSNWQHQYDGDFLQEFKVQ